MSARTQKRFLRIRHLEEMFGISRSTVWRWSRDGILPPPEYLGTIPVWDEERLHDAPKPRRAA